MGSTAMQTITEKLIGKKDGALGWNPQKRNAVSLEMYQALAADLEKYVLDE